jgi:hypothetical protein
MKFGQLVAKISITANNYSALLEGQEPANT